MMLKTKTTHTLTAFRSLKAFANNSDQIDAGFTSIPELMRTDADTILMFLSANNIMYTEPTDDPWYSAHIIAGPVYDLNGAAMGSTELYQADNAASPLGCTVQYQVCNPNVPSSSGCGPLTSQLFLNETLSMFSSEHQKQTFITFFFFLKSAPSAPSVVLAGIGATFLISRDSLVEGVQAPLPVNQ